MCVCVWREEVGSGCLPHYSPPYFLPLYYLFIYFFIIVYFYTDSSGLSGQHTARIHCFHSLPQFRDHNYLAFLWVMEIKTQISILMSQGFPNKVTTPASDGFDIWFFGQCQYFQRIWHSEIHLTSPNTFHNFCGLNMICLL